VVDNKRSAEASAGHHGQSDGAAARSGRARAAREKYKPEQVRCLLIAEALPDSLDRFFYYPDVRRADYLFLGVIHVLYPGMKDEFLATRRSSGLKEKILRRFQEDGFFLLDILGEPLRKSYGSLQRALPELLLRVEAVANQQTPIVLIKTTTFDSVYRPLKAAGYQKVFDNPIPFPSQGWQHRFYELFSGALKEMGVYWSRE
jgi:hypothetical protein